MLKLIWSKMEDILIIWVWFKTIMDLYIMDIESNGSLNHSDRSSLHCDQGLLVTHSKKMSPDENERIYQESAQWVENLLLDSLGLLLPTLLCFMKIDGWVYKSPNVKLNIKPITRGLMWLWERVHRWGFLVWLTRLYCAPHICSYAQSSCAHMLMCSKLLPRSSCMF